MKFIKRSIEGVFNNKLIADVVHTYQLDEDIVKLIIAKGYSTKQEIDRFLNVQNFSFHNPLLLNGMKEAVDIISQAIRLNKKITVLGDYDTDGICSTAILYHYFKSVHVDITYFLPNRFVDGYGLTNDTIDKIINQFQPDLLLTVDCGISGYKEIEYAKSKGLQVIVTDHHEIPEILPNCTVIDPKIKPQDYPFSELCGAGVAFKLVQALAGFEQARNLISIAAFATVADIVPLTDENRAIVFQGLKFYKEQLPKGVLKLMNRLKIEQLTTSDISIKIAPKINTAGRMGDANIAFRLFVEENDKVIDQKIKELESLNTVRVSDGDIIYQEALEMLSTQNVSTLKAIVLYKDNWNGGVLGIVCAKLVEKFNKPVCLMSKVEHEYKGSVRSIEKIDIYKQLSNLSDLLIRFGGHSQAGGMSILEENIEEFTRRLNENLQSDFADKQFELVKYYDLDLNKIELTPSFIAQMDMLEPFGFGNEKPVFKLNFNNARVMRLKNYNNHLKIKFENLDIIAWGLGHECDHIKTNSNKEILLELNGTYTYKNATYIQAKLTALKINKLNTNVKQEIVGASIVSQLENLTQTTEYAYEPFSSEQLTTILNKTLLQNRFGTLLVTYQFNHYTQLVNQYGDSIINYEMFTTHNKTGENAILYLPNLSQSINGFTNVIFMEPLLCNQVLSHFNAEQFYVCNDMSTQMLVPLSKLSVERSVFGQVHVAVKNMEKQGIIGEDEGDYFTKLSKLNPQLKNIKLDQFKFVCIVLQELKIFQIDQEDWYHIHIDESVKNPLDHSTIYNFVKLIHKIS